MPGPHAAADPAAGPREDSPAGVLLPDGVMLSWWLGREDGSVLAAHADTVEHRAASLMKVPVVLAWLAARAGHEDSGPGGTWSWVRVHDRFDPALPGQVVVMHEEYDQDPETWAALGQDVDCMVLAERAITVSGNLAVNLLLERVGLAGVDAELARRGVRGVAVRRLIEDWAAQAAGRENVTTARGMASLLCSVARREGGPPDGELEELMRRQEHRAGIAAAAGPGWTVASKSGWLDGVAHDAAILRRGGETRVLVVLASGPATVAHDDLVAAIRATTRSVLP